MSARPKMPPPVDLKTGFTRKVVCPRCGVEFGTPKRWDLDCPSCGHRWREESIRGRSERLSLWLGDVADRVVMPFFLLVGLAIVLALFAPLFYIFLRFSGHGAAAGLLAAVVLFLIAVCLYLMWFNKREEHSNIRDRARNYWAGPRRRGN